MYIAAHIFLKLYSCTLLYSCTVYSATSLNLTYVSDSKYLTMSSMKRPRTHSENRAVVCGLCYKKSKDMRKISANHLNQLHTLVETQYSLEDPRFQTVLCSGCVKVLSVYSKAPDKPEAGRKLRIPIYKNLTPPPAHNTRNSEASPCPCTVCDIARQNLLPGSDKPPMLECHWLILFPHYTYPYKKVQAQSVISIIIYFYF